LWIELASIARQVFQIAVTAVGHERAPAVGGSGRGNATAPPIQVLVRTGGAKRAASRRVNRGLARCGRGRARRVVIALFPRARAPT
jgi:hypothetical protein